MLVIQDIEYDLVDVMEWTGVHFHANMTIQLSEVEVVPIITVLKCLYTVCDWVPLWNGTRPILNEALDLASAMVQVFRAGGVADRTRVRKVILLPLCLWWLEESNFKGPYGLEPLRYTSHLLRPVESIHPCKRIDQCL